MSIFQKSVIKKHLSNLDKERVEFAFQKFKENYNTSKIEQIKELKEEEYQDGFLRDIFVDVLGYTLKPNESYNLAREYKNQADSKKADGAILKDDKAIAVIELKSVKTKDLKSITDQAFNYKVNQPECKYVITSNFQKLRFYIDYANEYEEFDLFNLEKEDFEFLYLILSKDSIFQNLPLKLKEETKFHEQEISDKLYKDYSHFKRKLFDNLCKNHPESDKLILFKKSQKLLDRFLFILFAEDSNLLPPNSISRIVERFELLKEEDAYKPLYEIFKQYFEYMNIGRKGKTSDGDIPAYNGGLFYTDECLDKFIIDDEILIGDLLNLSEYDFSAEVDVNILGHIFEHSLNEIEEVSAEIAGTAPDKTKSKRKKDGVFYTPKYITQYIVENTIGTLCIEKRKEIEIGEIEFDGSYRTKDNNLTVKGKKLYKKLTDYKDWLISLKIIDPACGSGAFLNQALNFLIEEHKIIDDIIAELTNSPLRLFDVDKTILENNLYGVDINEESVEIAKLSLWLRTAQKGRILSSLNDNIKCGNSLIDDPEVAGDKAFDWNKEFPEIMKKGGFDVVIGNPPYGAEIKEKQYYSKLYNFKSNADTYQLFTLLSGKLLNKNGLCGFIIPNSWMTRKGGTEFREKLLIYDFHFVIDFVSQVFVDANIDTCILIYSISPIKNRKKDILVAKVKMPETILSVLDYGKVNIGNWIKYDKFNCEFNDDLIRIFEKLNSNSSKLGEITIITGGYKPYQVGYGKSITGDFPQTKNDVENWVYHSNTKIDETYFPDIKGGNIQHYYIKPNKQWVKWGDWLMSPKKYEDFINSKIVVREVAGLKLNACYDDMGYFTNDTTHMIRGAEPDKLKFILSILNSKLIGWYFRKFFGESNDLFPKIKVNELKELPIILLENELQKPLLYKVNLMLSSSNKFQNVESKFLRYLQSQFLIDKPSKKLQNWYELDFGEFISELNKVIKTVGGEKLSKSEEMEWMEVFETKKAEAITLKNEIEKTDKEIDQMVYELYELTEEEIAIVEESVK